MNKKIKISIIVGVTILIAGLVLVCITRVGKNSDKSMSVDKWKTYTNQEYGFSFKYPPEWKIISLTSFPERAQLVIGPNEKDFYTFLFQNYKNAPTPTPRLAGDESLKSQRELDVLREGITNNPETKNYNNIFILENNARYSPFDSGFLNEANFFINKDYVYLTSYLPIEDNDCSTIQNPNAKCYILDEKNYAQRNIANIQAKADEINKGVVSVEVKKSIELFNKVLSTIEKL